MTGLRPTDRAIPRSECGGIYSIISQKGGTGKTSTAVHLAQAIGYKVLVIDLDSQANCTYALGGQPIEGKNSLTALMGVPLDDCIQQVDDDINLVPATLELKDASALLNNVGAEYKLKQAIDNMQTRADIILIDNPPALSQLTVCSLTASTGVIIPVQADIFSLQGLMQLEQTISQVRKTYNPHLTKGGLLMTMYDGRTSLTQEMTELLNETAEKMGIWVYNTKIRNNVKIKEAQALQKNLYKYAPSSHGAEDYMNLADEILWRTE